MNNQTYLLSDAMIDLEKQISSLKSPLIVDRIFRFKHFRDNRFQNSIQVVEFTFLIEGALFHDRIVHLILKSDPDRIVLERVLPTDAEISMEDFIEYMTPDLAEVLYFNIDLWYKN